MALRAGRVGVKPNQVDSTGKIISGGGGETSGINIETLLITDSGEAGTYDLIKQVTDYKLVVCVINHSAAGVLYKFSGIGVVNSEMINNYVPVTSEAFIGYFDFLENQKVTINKGNYTSTKFEIYGIK